MDKEGGSPPRTIKESIVIKNKLLEDVRVFLTDYKVASKLDNFFMSGDLYRELIRRITVELSHH